MLLPDIMPLPVELALTAAARLGVDMLGSAVLLVGAQLSINSQMPYNPKPCGLLGGGQRHAAPCTFRIALLWRRGRPEQVT